MAFIEMNMYSDVLQMDTTLNVLLPEQKHVKTKLQQGKYYPVLYVLHGFSDNYSSWIRKSIIEFVARNYEIIVVMPEVNNSFYTDMDNGLDYYTYIVEELPIKIANFFPASLKRGDTYIMGNSMGGYGAFKIAMSNPDKYAVAISFSGILGLDVDEKYILMNDKGFKRNFTLAFKDQETFKNSNNYLYNLARKLHDYEGEKPRLYHLCGTKDIFAYDMGLDFMNYVNSHHLLEIKYDEIVDGKHDWQTWNKYIEKAFEFLK